MKISKIFSLLITGMALSCSSGGSDDNGGNQSQNPRTQFPDNFLTTGASAGDFLSNASFNGIHFQIAYVIGQAPSQTSIDNLTDFIAKHTFKESLDISFSLLPLSSPDKESLDLNDDIAPLELENRTVYNTEDTLGVYIFFADAPAAGDEIDEGLVTLGSVYRNTSMVIYETNIRSVAASRPGITIADVETATLNHEFGHLLGLVNLGSPMVNNHEDISAPNHCNVPGCLMAAELEFNPNTGKYFGFQKVAKGRLRPGCVLTGNNVLKMLEHSKTGKVGVVPDLQQECALDLFSNGGRSVTITSKTKEY